MAEGRLLHHDDGLATVAFADRSIQYIRDKLEQARKSGDVRATDNLFNDWVSARKSKKDLMKGCGTCESGM
jgi:hypothetical protein